MIVAKVATPLTEVELARVLREGHLRAFGELPSEDRLAVAWAQCALEHGRGQFIYCHNLGNVTAGSRWVGDVYQLVVQERVRRDPDVWKTLTLSFRAHASPEAGAADYWILLARSFSSALARFDVGDAAGASDALSAAGFYTARAGAYTAAMVSLLAFYRRSIAPRLMPPPLSAEEVTALDQVAAHVLRVEREAREGQDGAAALERLLGPQLEPVSA